MPPIVLGSHAGTDPGPQSPTLRRGTWPSCRTSLAAGPARETQEIDVSGMPGPAAASGGHGGGPLRHHPLCQRRPAADEGERPAVDHRRPAHRPGRHGRRRGRTFSPSRAAPLTGGTVDCANDHRIVMAAAIAATACYRPRHGAWGPNAVQKSYPDFWEVYKNLGGDDPCPLNSAVSLQISVFGQSHGRAIGVVVDGLPAGEAIDLAELHAFLDRRPSGEKRPFHRPEGGRRAGVPLRAGKRPSPAAPRCAPSSKIATSTPSDYDGPAG